MGGLKKHTEPENERDEEEDGPPPLEDMTEHLQKLHLSGHVKGGASEMGGRSLAASSSADTWRVSPATPAEENATLVPSGRAIPTRPPGTQRPSPPAPSLRRGFFDAAPHQQRVAPRQRDGEKKKADIIVVNAPRGGTKSKRPNIPDFMRVEKDETPLTRVRDQMLAAMKPTPDLMRTVMEKPEIVEGMDDPDVMAAVAEVAKDPLAIKKFAGNPKVMRFYANMGSLMAERLQQGRN